MGEVAERSAGSRASAIMLLIGTVAIALILVCRRQSIRTRACAGPLAANTAIVGVLVWAVLQLLIMLTRKASSTG